MGGVDLSGYRYVIHPVTPLSLPARKNVAIRRQTSPHRVSAEAIGMPDKEDTVRGQIQSSGGSAANVFNC